MPKHVVVFAIFLFAVADSLAQRSQLSGTVVDPAGAGIGKAYVLIHSDAVDREHRKPYCLELRTNKEGQFTAILPEGFFDVFIGATGFTPYSKKIRTRAAAQEFQAVLELDLLYLAEHGDEFFEMAPDVQTEPSSLPDSLQDGPQ
ncbi:MAG TPA: carboxypeptidase-like regulatory domain-containing protein [Terriglobales bacterium]